MMKRILFLTLLFAITLSTTHGQNLLPQQDAACDRWVDSLMLKLTDEEKLGQLVMPLITTSAKTNLSAEVKATIANDVAKYHVGGFLFSKVTIKGQAELDNEVQRQSAKYKLPPALIAIDGEWGPVKRLTDGVAFPSATIIGRIQDTLKRNELCYEYGREMARELHLMGVHINFAPILDINSNPKNPVIGTRAFGTCADTVISCGLKYAQGLEDGGVLSVAKHFPGHGDTDTDSHQTLPRISHTAEVLRGRELLPFQAYINQGLGGMMVAHLDVPALNGGQEGIPASASWDISQKLLQEEMHFKGLVITDGLAMKGVASRKDICVEALLAGCDIVLQPTPMEQQWKSMTQALKQGIHTMTAQEFRQLVEAKCRKVLRWKYALIVSRYPLTDGIPLVNTTQLPAAVNTEAAKQLNIDLRKGWKSPTETDVDPTMQTIEQNAAVTSLDPQPAAQAVVSTSTTLTSDLGIPYDSQIMTAARWQAMSEHIDSLAEDLVQTKASPGCQILVAHKGEIIYSKAWGWKDPEHHEPLQTDTYYDLASLSKAVGTVPAVMHCMDKHEIKLTDNLQKYLPEFKGSSIGRLTIRQCLLHETGLPSGHPFYQMTVDASSIPTGLYRGKKGAPFTVQQDAKTWFSKNFRWDSQWISDKQAAGFLPLAKDLWINAQFRDTMVYKLSKLPQKGIGRYRYSDLNFILLRLVVERVSGLSLDQLLYSQIPQLYGQDGRLVYRPLDMGITSDRIAPTEQDDAIRRQTLRGFVHDEAAAWSGGVEGNAGLFGSAEMLFPLLQSWLDEGWIVNPQTGNREHMFKATTVKTFLTGKSGISRRGLGFDKPDTKGGKSPCSNACSPQTFGHTGFTGTCFWVDPKHELVYIFLSNRVSPHRWNTRLTSQGYRTRIQDVIYEALAKDKK